MIFQGILIVECMGGPPPCRLQQSDGDCAEGAHLPSISPCYFRLATWDILNVLRWCVDAKRSEITKPISCQGVQGKWPYRPDAIPMCLRPIVSLTWFDRERSLTFLNCFQKVACSDFPFRTYLLVNGSNGPTRGLSNLVDICSRWMRPGQQNKKFVVIVPASYYEVTTRHFSFFVNVFTVLSFLKFHTYTHFMFCFL